jgi:hypothetical protein
MAIGSLVATSSGEAFAVKDSFDALDGAALGLRLLFEAEWIVHAADRAAPVEEGPVCWVEVREPEALTSWEDAWRGTPPPAELAAVRLFPAQLLGDPDVVFLAGERDGRIVATGVLHRTEKVVGLSNVTGDLAGAFRACAAASSTRFPGLPVVGYERGPELEAALAAGFERLGGLAVWERRKGSGGAP